MALDRAVLLSNLVTGTLLLAILVGMGAWPLAVIGWIFVLLASFFLSFMAARNVDSTSARAVVWGVPGLAAVVLWVAILYPIGPPNGTASDYVLPLGLGASIGLSCYLAWQLCSWLFRETVKDQLAASALAGIAAGVAALLLILVGRFEAGTGRYELLLWCAVSTLVGSAAAGVLRRMQKAAPAHSLDRRIEEMNDV